jgi:hypothetical protein
MQELRQRGWKWAYEGLNFSLPQTLETKLDSSGLWAGVEPHSASTVDYMKKSVIPPEPAAKSGRGTDTVAPSEKSGSPDLGFAGLGLAERRHFIRPLPVPDAVESDGDTDWATFQALISEKPKD